MVLDLLVAIEAALRLQEIGCKCEHVNPGFEVHVKGVYEHAHQVSPLEEVILGDNLVQAEATQVADTHFMCLWLVW